MYLHEVQVHEKRLDVPGMILDPCDRGLEGAQVAPAHIVGHDENNVGFARLLRLRRMHSRG